VRLHIDTGSSDLWVNTPQSTFCTSSSNPCAYAGTYSANESSTYEYISSIFNISYVDGSGASGDYVSDTVTIGSQKLDRLQFGIGYSSNNGQGILGIGYPLNEVQAGHAGLGTYNNLPAQLVADGIIQSNAYSIWLNDLDSSTGNILFGGVDTEKYTPPLSSIPVESTSGRYGNIMVTLTGLQLDNKTLHDGDLAIAVLLDTGSSLTYLPDQMVQDIYSTIGALHASDAETAFVACSLAQSTSHLTFSFSGPTITVAMNELVLDLVTASGGRPKFHNGDSACLFGIAPAGQGTYVLGDTFLRSAYVVYDLENNVVALAQTKFNASASAVVEIGKGEGAIPGATVVQNPVKATEGLRGINGGSPPAKKSGAGRMRPGVAGGWGLGVVVGVVGVLGVVVGL
jgi:hypothetical protein